MSDGQLELIADDFTDLTQTAQEVLRSEMKMRGLEDPGTVKPVPERQIRMPEPPPDELDTPTEAEDTDEETDVPHDYTWKTLLCECEDADQARQLYLVLRNAGIQSWAEGVTTRVSSDYPRVFVAADQLDQAREIAQRPIPQEIIEESKLTVPEFEAPTCPHCGAEDPVLEGVDPSNTWLCEACGEEWSDAAAEPSGAPDKNGK